MYISNIGTLWQLADAHAGRLAGPAMASGIIPVRNAWLRVDGDRIAAIGSMDDFVPGTEEVFDARGASVFPTFCDSHTHIIYAGSREGEFLDKIAGLSYEEIARRGGGILNSADRLHQASDNELLADALGRAQLMMSRGTGAFEVKSGYGLNTADELKMLRVAARLAQEVDADVKITFLGAHAVGREFTGRQADYVDMLIADMLPAVAAEGLAEFVDVFCDEGFFTPDETSRILEAAARYGMRPKIHANELACSGGVQVGVAHNALSVDHLERMGTDEIELLKTSSTIATMLPGASFFSNLPYAPARKAIDAGLAVALASDYNPGSSPSGDMRMVWALGCIKMRLLPVEALAACTLNGAAAMDLAATNGGIAPGRKASLIISPVNINYIPYAYTEPWISKVMLRGRFV